MCNFFRVLIVLSFPGLGQASLGATDLRQSLSFANLTKPLINEIVVITPLENHHFNLEAPQTCGDDASMEKSALKIQCQFHNSGDRQVTVSVCDNQKNYCKQENIQISVLPQSSQTPRLQLPAQSETVSMQNQAQKKLMNNFVSILPEEFSKAVQGKKGALVLVSTDWCPPCNVLKEFLLPTVEFQRATQDYLLIYVDGDSPSMTAWKPILQSFYYPSFVFLNPDRRRVDVLTGYQYFTDFNQWLSQAYANREDTIEDLQKRMEARKERGTWQRVKDVFKNDESLKKDQDRWVQFLESTAQFEQALSYLESWQRFDQEFLTAKLQYSDLWFGPQTSLLDEQAKKNKMEKLAIKMLVDVPPKDFSEDWIIAYLMRDQCGVGRKQKRLLSDQTCQKLRSQFMKDRQKRKQKVWPQLLAMEQVIEQARFFETMGQLSQDQDLPQVAQASFQKCADEWESVSRYSPLREKSRASRMKKVSCLKEIKGQNNLAVIQSLVRDYPYDATFHALLADHYLQNKQFDLALKANVDAMRYSYGDSWGKNLVKQITILQALGQKELALKTIQQNLKEISLDKDSKKQWWLNSLRAQQKQLEESKVK